MKKKDKIIKKIALSLLFLFFIITVILLISDTTLILDYSDDLKKEYIMPFYIIGVINITFITLTIPIFYGLIKLRKWVVPFSIIFLVSKILNDFIWLAFFEYITWSNFLIHMVGDLFFIYYLILFKNYFNKKIVRGK